jgi:hypothetical protein
VLQWGGARVLHFFSKMLLLFLKLPDFGQFSSKPVPRVAWQRVSSSATVVCHNIYVFFSWSSSHRPSEILALMGKEQSKEK